MTWRDVSGRSLDSAVTARDALFVAILVAAWIPTPLFPDLGASESFAIGEGHSTFSYAVFAITAAVAAAFVWPTDKQALVRLATPSNIALVAWIGVSCVASQDVGTSVKRAAMLCFVAFSSLSLFLLPRNRSDLEKLLSFVALLIVGLCYFGIVFLPQYSIHQATDLAEPLLAGDWRGFYGHKNMASGIFSILAFIGLFLLQTERRVEGGVIFILSLIFVIASGGKSSTAICFLTIVLSLIAARARNPATWSLIVFSPLALLNLVGVGAAIWPGLASITAALPIDQTFTGRTIIWSFAADRAAQKMAFGYGFVAFWNTDALRYGMEQTNIWAGDVAHAHNGYLDAALNMGMPGLFVTLWALVVAPACDLRRVLARGDEPALVMLLMQIWMFSLYLSSLESFFFDRAQPAWIAMLFAVFGARYLAEFRVIR